MVKELDLKPIGQVNICSVSDADITVNKYLVNIVLANNVLIKNVEVCESEIGMQGHDLLIGMNIITLGDFAISNYNNKTRFSFRIPSSEDFNYVYEIKKQMIINKSHKKPKKKK